MREYLINAKNCFSIGATHSYLKEQLELADYYGRNLDALWDLLMEISHPTKITLIHGDRLSLYLGDYGIRLYRTLVDASIENENIVLVTDRQL